jgi:hypothetical protein
MIRSVRRFDACAAIQVFALDGQCATILRDLFGAAVTVVEPPDFPELRATRSRWAYYATLKPLGVVQALERAAAGSAVLFVDADTWFFSDPSPLFGEFEGASIGLSPHRFAPGNEGLDVFGKYNAGCILWRADAAAQRCANDWSRDCLEWCGEQPDEQGRFMNQGYLTCWPERYSGVHVIRHPGANLAPWNIVNYDLETEGAGISVNGQPLIFYHFSGLVPCPGGVWLSFHDYPGNRLEFLRERLYGPYLAAVEAESELLQRRYGVAGTGNVRTDLKVGPGVLEFRASRPTLQDGAREAAENELERYRKALRALMDADMNEAALLALQTAGPPVHGSRAEWDDDVKRCLQVPTPPANVLRRGLASLRSRLARPGSGG